MEPRDPKNKGSTRPRRSWPGQKHRHFFIQDSLGVLVPLKHKDIITHYLVQRSVWYIFAPYQPGNELLWITPKIIEVLIACYFRDGSFRCVFFFTLLTKRVDSICAWLTAACWQFQERVKSFASRARSRTHIIYIYERKRENIFSPPHFPRNILCGTVKVSQQNHDLFWFITKTHVSSGRYQRLQHNKRENMWGVLKMGDPQVSMGFKTKSWSSMTWMMTGGTPMTG